MYNNFKVGDQIICVDPTESRERLTKNKAYTVLKFRFCEFYNKNIVMIKDDSGIKLEWYATRFKKSSKSKKVVG